MSNNTSVQKLIVKGTHDDLPETAPGRGSKSNPLWDAVAMEARMNPGRWVAFEIPGKNGKQLGSPRTMIKSGKYSSFEEGAWDAAVRGDVLYVKYMGETSADVVDIKSREVA